MLSMQWIWMYAFLGGGGEGGCINFETGTISRLMISTAQGWDEWYEGQRATEDDFTEIIENKETSIQKAR